MNFSVIFYIKMNWNSFLVTVNETTWDIVQWEDAFTLTSFPAGPGLAACQTCHDNEASLHVGNCRDNHLSGRRRDLFPPSGGKPRWIWLASGCQEDLPVGGRARLQTSVSHGGYVLFPLTWRHSKTTASDVKTMAKRERHKVDIRAQPKKKKKQPKGKRNK